MSVGEDNFANWSDSEESGDESPGKSSNSDRRCRFCVKLVPKDTDVKVHEKRCSAALRNPADLVTCRDGSRRFLCDICFRFFKYLTGLNKHKSWHEPPGGFACRHCDARYCTAQELEKHKEESHQVYKCQICKSIHETLDNYLNHIKTEHNGLDRIWVHCDDCPMNFKSQTILDYHKRTKCGTIKPFKCDECGSHYQTKATLNIHKLIHTGEKSFCCSFCGKSFLSKGQLTIHERKHTGEKPYKCEICGKAFSYRESLVTHSSVHTGIKPYACEACDARFSCVGNLQKHRRTRPNSCGLPQYCVNKKAAPRASNRVPGTLTMSNVKITKANKVLGLKNKGSNIETKRDKTINTEQENANKQDSESSSTNYEIATENTDNKSDAKETIAINTIEMLDIQILNEPVEKDITYTESEPNCLFGEVYQIVEIEDEQINSNDICKMVNKIEPLLSEGTQYNQEDDPLTSEIDDDIKSGSFEDVYLDQGHYDQNDMDMDNYEGDNMMLVIMKEDNVDKNESIPLSIIKSQEEIIHEEMNYNREPDVLTSVRSKSEIEQQQCNSEGSEPECFIDDLDTLTKPISSSIAKKDVYECSLCPKIYHNRRPFLKHLKSDHYLEQPELQEKSRKTRQRNTGTHACPLCKRMYSDLKFLDKHIKRHGIDGKLTHKSSCCSRFFESKEDADDHAIGFHNRMVSCVLCSKTFSSPEKLKKHKQSVHTMQKNRQEKANKKYSVCQKCGKKFTSKIALSDHERSDCGRSPLYKCDVCNKNFHSAGSLKTHKTMHTGDLPHLCNYCGKAFRTFGQVKVHERKHNGEKPFKCTMCPKVFAYRESLLTHISVHTGLKRFMCEGCGRRFSCISNLLMHRKNNQSTCGTVPNNTKPFSETIGISRGKLYVGEKPM